VLRVYTLGGAPEVAPVRKHSTAKKKSTAVNTASTSQHAQKTP
jgi:hypothetical protein